MRIAVITLVAGRHAHLVLQQSGLAAGTRQPDHYVVVTMDDPEAARVAAAGPPPADPVPVRVPAHGRLPLAAARNAGARHALDAGADLLIFLDVDCVPGTSAVEYYARYATDGVLLCGTVSYLPPPPATGYRLAALPGLARPHPGRPAPSDGHVERGGDPALFWSLSFALTSSTWKAIGGFHEEYEGYGGEDTDFAMKAVRAGAELWWVGGAPVHHQYHPTTSPPVEHLDDILRNGALFKKRWGRWPMEGWLRDFADLGLVRYDASADSWSEPVAPERDAG